MQSSSRKKNNFPSLAHIHLPSTSKKMEGDTNVSRVLFKDEVCNSKLPAAPPQLEQNFRVPESPQLTVFDPTILPDNPYDAAGKEVMDPSMLRRFLNLNLLQRNLDDSGSRNSTPENSPENRQKSS